MAYTIDHYNALVTAIAGGARSVRYGDKQVDYRTLDEMLRLKKSMEIELGLNTEKPSGRRYAEQSKGLL